ncbi:MAG: hypothetical protein ACJAXM_001142 [Arenicella sp.]|jgi:hypothetical protein
MKLLVLIGICSCLSGCALTLEMMAISGISYLATGKSLSDNAFSLVTNRDCALHRVMTNEVICTENTLPTSDTNDEFLLARTEVPDTIKTKVTTAQSILNSVPEEYEDVPSILIATFNTANTRNFSIAIEETKTPLTEHLSAQTFAVVGSFNSYQYAQRRNDKYVNFNPQIIKNQADSATQYRVVVGPITRDDFIAELPKMVGAETQLPWEIDLCADDMFPPPCNNNFAVNTLEQQSATWVAASTDPETLTLR